MALQLDVQRARELGCFAYYTSPADLLIPDPARPGETIVNVSYVRHKLWKIPIYLLQPQKTMIELGLPMYGSGWDWRQVPVLILPGLLFFVFYMLLRYCCREPFSRFGLYMGVATPSKRMVAQGKRGKEALTPHAHKKLFKFQNQLWLMFSYSTSALVGYYVLRDYPWFKLPLDRKAVLDLLLPYPTNPSLPLFLLYCHGFGFYLAEFVSLLVLEKNVKRMDYLEYVIHHVVTMWLLMASHVTWDHQLGGYVLFLHDASDILLCVIKVVHYMIEAEEDQEAAFHKRNQARGDGRAYKKPFLFRYVLTWWVEDGIFFCMMVTFLFFRMYCYPSIAQMTLYIGPYVRNGNWTVYTLLIMLSVALQGLNLYWSVLMVAMAIRVTLLGDTRKDIRSDSDEKEEEEEKAGEDGHAAKNQGHNDARRSAAAQKLSRAAAAADTTRESGQGSKEDLPNAVRRRMNAAVSPPTAG